MGGKVLRLVDDLGGMQERLRRNAADIETHAPERRPALDQCHFPAEIGSSEGGSIAARAGPQHEDLGGDVGSTDGGGVHSGILAEGEQYTAGNRQSAVGIRLMDSESRLPTGDCRLPTSHSTSWRTSARVCARCRTKRAASAPSITRWS